MKNLIIILFFGSSPILLASDWHDRWDKAGSTWKEKWTNTFNEIETYPEKEKIEILGAAVRAKSITGRWEQLTEDQLAIGNHAAQILSVISGHAKFFGDRIHAAYEPLKGPNPGSFKSSAQSEMMYSFETLKNLPSPETVRVLGEMLSETWQLPLAGEYTPPALAYPAMTTLGDLGIRNAPWKPIIIVPDAEGAIPAWQVWWEEVKSGKRSFSFVGQKSEYRFKPDGTWDTIPISLPPGEVVPKAPISVTPQAAIIPTVQAQDRTWLWITSLSVLLLAVVGWLIQKKSRA